MAAVGIGGRCEDCRGMLLSGRGGDGVERVTATSSRLAKTEALADLLRRLAPRRDRARRWASSSAGPGRAGSGSGYRTVSGR